MTASRLLFVLCVSASSAPLQCPSTPPPEQAREDQAPEALWILAQRFSTHGDTQSSYATLRFLVERYPSSRFAERARITLTDSGTP
jgi:TolA-binding protein